MGHGDVSWTVPRIWKWRQVTRGDLMHVFNGSRARVSDRHHKGQLCEAEGV